MPRGENPNSLKALEENRQKTQFRGESAVKANKKSQEVKAVYKSLSEDLKEQCTPEEIHEINKRLREMAKHGNLKAYELIRDGLGEKPTEKIDIRDSSSEALDEYFQRTGADEASTEG